MPIVWTKVTDQLTTGELRVSFLRVGELAEGTRYVQFAINGVPQIGKDFKPDYAIGVIEAAILASRLDFLPRGKVEREIAYLESAVQKTAGPAEAEAWSWLMHRIKSHYGD